MNTQRITLSLGDKDKVPKAQKETKPIHNHIPNQAPMSKRAQGEVLGKIIIVLFVG